MHNAGVAVYCITAVLYSLVYLPKFSFCLEKRINGVSFRLLVNPLYVSIIYVPGFDPKIVFCQAERKSTPICGGKWRLKV